MSFCIDRTRHVVLLFYMSDIGFVYIWLYCSYMHITLFIVIVLYLYAHLIYLFKLRLCSFKPELWDVFITNKSFFRKLKPFSFILMLYIQYVVDYIIINIFQCDKAYTPSRMNGWQRTEPGSLLHQSTGKQKANAGEPEPGTHYTAAACIIWSDSPSCDIVKR